MKCYVNKQKKLAIDMNYKDKFGKFSSDSIQILEGKLTDSIQIDVENAMKEIIDKYSQLFDTPIIDDLFTEKEKQLKQSYDVETTLTEMFEVEYEDS